MYLHMPPSTRIKSPVKEGYVKEGAEGGIWLGALPGAISCLRVWTNVLQYHLVSPCRALVSCWRRTSYSKSMHLRPEHSGQPLPAPSPGHAAGPAAIQTYSAGNGQLG